MAMHNVHMNVNYITSCALYETNQVLNIGIVFGKQVAWVRVNTHSILTIHNKVITRNYRISLSQADARNWVLRINNIQESDRGWYMCQINTDPMRYQAAYVEVVGNRKKSLP